MDFSQIELIYRAEGNANLVVAIPEYKKVLRLPKANISTKSSPGTTTTSSSTTSPSCDLKGLASMTEPYFIFYYVHYVFNNINFSFFLSHSIPYFLVEFFFFKLTPKLINFVFHGYYQKADTGITVSEQQEDILDPVDNLAYTKLLGTLIGSEYIYVQDTVATISQTDSERISSICRPFRPGKWIKFTIIIYFCWSNKEFLWFRFELFEFYGIFSSALLFIGGLDSRFYDSSGVKLSRRCGICFFFFRQVFFHILLLCGFRLTTFMSNGDVLLRDGGILLTDFCWFVIHFFNNNPRLPSLYPTIVVELGKISRDIFNTLNFAIFINSFSHK